MKLYRLSVPKAESRGIDVMKCYDADMDRATTRRAPDERDALASRLRSVLENHSAVRWAYLFGSAGRSEAFRDLDVGVVLRPERGRGAVQFGSLVASLESAVPG